MFGDFVKIPKHPAGFTLAELLVSLLILGEIATFTIPKMLSNQQNQRHNAAAKEVAAMVAQAYQIHVNTNGYSTAMRMHDLTPYLNYVSIDTTSKLDDHVGANMAFDCSNTGTWGCYRLHNGGIFYYWKAVPMGGTGVAPSSFVLFYYDPDGVTSNTTADNSSKAVCFFLYYNGLLTTRGNVIPNSGGMFPGNFDPSWFSW